MRVYGKIKSTFWTRTKRFSERAKLLAVYLLSGPHGSTSGCFYLPPAYIMGDLGWAQETVTETLSELSRNGFAYHCSATDWVLLPNFIKHNPPENGNVGKRLAVEASAIPEDFTYLSEFIASLKPYAERLPKGFVKEMETLSRTVNDTKAERYANPTPLPTPPIQSNPIPTTPETEHVRNSAREVDEPLLTDPPEPGAGFEEGEGRGEPDHAEPMPDEDLAIGDVSDLPAPKPREAWAVLGQDLLAMTGLDQKQGTVTTGIVAQWLADWSEDDIRAAVSDVVERETYDATIVGGLKYFEPAIRRRVETRNAEQTAAARKFWAEMPQRAAEQFIGHWRAGGFEWEADIHGPAPDHDGFLGPDDLRGPKHPQPIKQPANTEHQEARTA